MSTLPTSVGVLPLSWRSGAGLVVHAHLPVAVSRTTLCGRPPVDEHGRVYVRPERVCERCMAVLALAEARLERRAGQVVTAEPASDAPGRSGAPVGGRS